MKEDKKECKGCRFAVSSTYFDRERCGLNTTEYHCHLLPPQVVYRQGAVHERQHWAGTVTSSINPAALSVLPAVKSDGFCSKWVSAAKGEA